MRSIAASFLKILIAAASISKLPIDDLDRQPPGVIGLHRIRQLKQFLLGGLGRRKLAVLLEFHFPRFLSYLASAFTFPRHRNKLLPVTATVK
jgi:hypothetical protein